MKQTITLLVLLLFEMNVEAGYGFSVAKDRQVEFSSGNLQYQPATGTFRFAAHQQDVVGYKNEKVSPTYRGWIDLFGWATSGYDNRANDPDVIYVHPWDWMCRLEHSGNPRNPFGYGPSTTQAEWSLIGTSRQYDWGVYNAIKNGGNQPNQWRTLTHEEWQYLLTQRKNAYRLRMPYRVGKITGLLLLPDDFEGDARQIKFSKLQKMGAVFLPAAGTRYHLAVTEVGTQGTYWSATAAGSDAAYFLGIYPDYVSMSSELYGRNAGRSVRLVRDVK
ncbi:MAG: hypothetical protein MJZ88_05605 [Paludibacteraceae bacterium]|nr:hypothetical protein [Paludibacteraceae bacterium]